METKTHSFKEKEEEKEEGEENASMMEAVQASYQL